MRARPRATRKTVLGQRPKICWIVSGLCAWQYFVYVLFGGEKHINKIPPKARDNPVDMCFFFVGFFRSKQCPKSLVGRFARIDSRFEKSGPIRANRFSL